MGWTILWKKRFPRTKESRVGGAEHKGRNEAMIEKSSGGKVRDSISRKEQMLNGLEIDILYR